jgi:hypothetical protein
MNENRFSGRKDDRSLPGAFGAAGASPVTAVGWTSWEGGASGFVPAKGRSAAMERAGWTEAGSSAHDLDVEGLPAALGLSHFEGDAVIFGESEKPMVGNARAVKKDIFQSGGLNEPVVFLFIEPFDDAFVHFQSLLSETTGFSADFQKKSRASADSAQGSDANSVLSGNVICQWTPIPSEDPWNIRCRDSLNR